MLIYIVAGLTTGSIFGLAGMGLVLTYKTSGIFNFAHGALAAVSAYLFYFLYAEHNVPWYLAAAVVLVVAGGGLGMVLEFLTRRWGRVSQNARVVGTIGLLLAIEAILELVFPPGTDREVPQFLSMAGFQVAGTTIPWYRVIIAAFGLLTAVALSGYLRRARVGSAMRAVVDNPDLLDLAGIPPTRVRRRAWVLGSVLASASGILLAPLLPLDPTGLTFLIVTAFGAAAVGGFSSLPLTYAGGLAIGIGQALLQDYLGASAGVAAGLPSSLPFLVLFVLLLAARRLPQGLLKAGVRPPSLVVAWRPSTAVQAPALGGLAVFLALVPLFAGLHLTDWTRLLAFTVLFLSLGLLVRVSRQVSLAQVTFMAIGVATFSQVTVHLHLPWLLALAVTGLIAAPIGAVLAIPAIRFPGIYLALATLGFGILVEYMFYGQTYMFGSVGLPTIVPRPGLGALASDRGYYYVVFAIAVVVVACVMWIERSRLGRLLRAIGGSPLGVASTGASVNVTLVVVFCLAASLAAMAGALDGAALTEVTAGYYQPILSLQLFVLVVLAMGGTPWYAVLAAFVQTVLPDYISTGQTVSYWLTLLFGVGALAWAAMPEPGVPDRLVRFLRPIARPRGEGAGTVAKEQHPPQSRRHPGARGDVGDLTLTGITVAFGGLVAAADVTLTAPQGAITGLIGPNGAGKSTVFNACTGLVRMSSGDVRLGGRSLRHLPSSARARLGLGRTFQHMELMESLTVRENVAIGAEGNQAGWNPVSHLIQTRGQRAAVAGETAHALELCGLSALAERTVGSLSTGQRRLVELARCVAGPFRFLLLDEPSSGLDGVETETFGDILLEIVRQRGIGILLIEHDMSLVNRLCDQVHVLDFGKQIFSGTAAQMQQSAVVRSAYLGTKEAEADLSLVAGDLEAEIRDLEAEGRTS
jgi:ABC-type branched-subunit amino acid transport system ATPase component/branched-subunit amino acid ABC-type transport system permease component